MIRIQRLLLLVILSMGAMACGSAHFHTSSMLPPYRHPLFYQSASSGSSDVGLGLELPDPPRDPPTVRCVSAFRHPVLNRCEVWPTSMQPDSVSIATPQQSLVQTQLALASRARSFLQTPKFTIHGRSYPHDCGGLVMATYQAENRPLEALLTSAKSEKNSVLALYQAMERRGWLHHHKVPTIGDLVFFDNTFDRNHDGSANDPLTHVGIVEGVDANGTISIIHHARGGVLRTKMNLFQPHLRRDPKTHAVLNHFLRQGASDRRSQKRLTGELFRAFATVVQ